MTGKELKQISENERRTSLRTSIRIWAKEKSEDMTSFHLVSNISHSGLYIEKKLPLPIGSTINLELDLLDPYGQIKLKGTVNNTYKDSDSNITGTGISFVDISETDKKKLDVYLKHQGLTD